MFAILLTSALQTLGPAPASAMKIKPRPTPTPTTSPTPSKRPLSSTAFQAQKSKGSRPSATPDPKPWGPAPLSKPLATPLGTSGNPFKGIPSKPKLNTDNARKSQQDAFRAKAEQTCERTSGRWTAEVTAYSLKAIGSDVDQIYGEIYISTNAAWSDVHSTRGGSNWSRGNVWKSEDSINLGKTPWTSFPKITVYNNLMPVTTKGGVRVHFGLFDEDDGKGGSNDEFFFLGNNRNRLSNDNYVWLDVAIPTCSEAPEFDRSTRTQVIGKPLGGNTNMVILNIQIRAYRLYN